MSYGWGDYQYIESILIQQERLEILKKTLMKKFFTKGIGYTQLKSTPLGEIPENWDISNFKDLINLMKSGLSRKIVSDDIGVPVLISGNIQDDKLDFSELKYWYKDDPQGANVSNYILNDGDILLCFINSLSQIGKCCIYENIGRETIYTTNLFRIVAKPEVCNEFLYYLICSDYIQSKINKITKPAVNQASFTKEDFLKIKVLLPPLKEQELIARHLKEIDRTREFTRENLKASFALRGVLISQVF